MVKGDQNIMVILSSPSGVGKTTITKKIQQKYNSFKISVSHTTRSARSNEVEGVDYHFVNEETFKKLIEDDKFYEYAKIFDNYYGTLKKNVDENIKKNDILFDIDWQGTKQLSKHKKLNLLKIYLITHSKEELKKRLIKRNQNSSKEIELRFKSSQYTLSVHSSLIRERKYRVRTSHHTTNRYLKQITACWIVSIFIL